MTTWTRDQLTKIGDAHEMHIAGRRSDGTLRKPVIVWVVRIGDGLYTRSVNGPDAAWFRGTRATHQGHITAGGVDIDVEFVDVADRPDENLDDDIDEAYRVKYGRNSSPVAHITSATARMTTLKLQPTTTKDD